MCLAVYFGADEASNELQRCLRKDGTIGRTDDLVYEINIYAL